MGAEEEGAGVKRSELKRRTPLRARSGQKKASPWKDAAARVFFRQRGVCACGCGRAIAPFPLGYHHVFPKARWPQLIAVDENIVGLAGDCHANHEAGLPSLPRSVCKLAEQLVVDGPMENYLDRRYGAKEG